jgi:hypothetical protein
MVGFLLGIPPALCMCAKTLTGHELGMKDLPKANALAPEGKAKETGAIASGCSSGFPITQGCCSTRASATCRLMRASTESNP